MHLDSKEVSTLHIQLSNNLLKLENNTDVLFSAILDTIALYTLHV